MPQFIVAKKLFETHEVKRTPITLSEQAREFLNTSNHQGRLFAQALQEHFGNVVDVIGIAVDLVCRKEHFPTHPREEDMLLEIMVQHTDSRKDHRYLINPLDVTDVHPVHKHALLFEARRVANQLVTLYPHK